MRLQNGQRWHWIYTGQLASDLIIEIVNDRDGLYIQGKCLQIISSTDPFDFIGKVTSIIPWTGCDETSGTIVYGLHTLIYLNGQDAP